MSLLFIQGVVDICLLVITKNLNKFFERDDSRSGMLKSLNDLLEYLYQNFFSREKVYIF